MWIRIGKGTVALIALGTAAVVIAALLPIWPCLLLEHFRLQVAIGGAIVTAIALALRLRTADVAAIATLVTLVAIAPDLSASRRPLPAGAPIHMLVLNVRMTNATYAQVAALIEHEHPDVVALVEVSHAWLDALAPALAEFSARIEGPSEHYVGVALYARGTLRGEIRSLSNRTLNIFAEVQVNGATFRVAVVHPIPPVSAKFQRELMRYFAELGALVRGDPRIVVAGDFNATPWSRPFATMMTASGLCDSRAGFGAQTSFPAEGALLRIPIDHVLTSCAIGVRARRVGPDVGSDHLPVVVDLVIPP